MLRVLVTLTTIGTVSLIVRHYRILIQYLKVRDLIRPSGKYANCFTPCLETLRSTGLLRSMILECLICTLHSPPKLNAIFFIPNARDQIPYSMDIVLTLFPIMRVYLLWRVFIGESFWSDERAERVCREICNTQGGPIFTLKCEMKERPYIIIMFTMVIIIFILGFAIRSAEL